MGKLAVQKLYPFFRHPTEKILPNHGGDVRRIEMWLVETVETDNKAAV